MDTKSVSLKLANKLREKNIKVIIEMSNRKIKKVLETANRNNIPYVIILGGNEVENKKLDIKNMKEGTVTSVDIDDIEKMYEIIKNSNKY